MVKKKYVRLLAPPEFESWVEQRRVNIETVARNMGVKKPITKIRAMRLIALSNGGVELTNEMLRKIKRSIK